MNHSVYLSFHVEDAESKRIALLLSEKLKLKNYTVLSSNFSLNFKDSVQEFKKKQGQAEFVILVLSDRYLKEKVTMSEALEIMINPNFEDRIYPLLLEDAGINDPLKSIEYLSFWDDKVKELNEKIAILANPAYAMGIYKEIELYNEIRRIISNLNATIRDMYGIGVKKLEEQFFEPLCELIGKYLTPNSLESESEITFVFKNHEEFSSKLKETIADNLRVGLFILGEKLNKKSSIYDDFLLIKGRYSRLEGDIKSGILTQKDIDIERARIQYALQSLLNDLDNMDLILN